MSELIQLKNLNMETLINESKVFCVLPWVHIHQTSKGNVSGCCIQAGEIVEGAKNLDDIVNSEYMKSVRKNMIEGKHVAGCSICYNHEKDIGISARKHFNNEYYEDHYEQIKEAIEKTSTDGHITDFKMHYYDMRSSNVCNMKCRSCGPEYSTLWEAEAKKHNLQEKVTGIYTSEFNSKTFIDDIINHVPNMNKAYFAGGEPLIMEEHYQLLQKMIDTNHTDIKLTYSTNASTLKFKNYDLMSMWDKFDYVEVVASIDHFGERAEYIRHGTKWNEVEENLKYLSKTDNIDFATNTVITALNYCTIDQLIKRLHIKGIIRPNQSNPGLYPAENPEYLCARILPPELKKLASERIEVLIKYLTAMGYRKSFINDIKDLQAWVNTENLWDVRKDEFVTNIKLFDQIRGEDFSTTFPELAMMING